MGKTPKPLTILVHPDFAPWPEVEALRRQGHLIVPADAGHAADLSGWDCILHPKAWRMTPDLRPYLDLAVKAARNAKYGRTEAPNDTLEGGSPTHDV